MVQVFLPNGLQGSAAAVDTTDSRFPRDCSYYLSDCTVIPYATKIVGRISRKRYPPQIHKRRPSQKAKRPALAGRLIAARCSRLVVKEGLRLQAPPRVMPLLILAKYYWHPSYCDNKCKKYGIRSGTPQGYKHLSTLRPQ